MAEVPERRPGEVLDGRYQLVERLGRGGFGDVWRAEELLPDGAALREVALKLLHPQMAAGTDWTAEARIIASFRHPALVTIYAAGVLELERTIPFVAMELLLGDSLGDIVKRGELIPWRRVLAWAREAAAALDEIHRAGVVHLDLKPANLFLARSGEIKVLDFGIARQGMARAATATPLSQRGGEVDEMSTAAFMVAQQEEAQRGASGATVAGATSRSVVGTPGFMAPEIFEDGEATPAADAYALAGCIVQMISGLLPQDIPARPQADSGTTVQAWFADVQAATVRGRIRDLGEDHPEMPRALTALLHRWLTLDPVARRVSRGTMRAALDEVWRCPEGFVGIPYRGLLPYRVRDEGKLFGRSSEIERIARDLQDLPGIVLQGDAGVGLLSLALAGVVPAVARHFTDGRHDWVCCQIDLSRDGSPDELVVAAIETLLAGRPSAAALDDRGDPIDRLRSWVGQAVVGVVVVIDDVHHALTSAASERRQLTRLAQLVAAGQPGLRLLATLRASRTGELLELEDLASLVRPWLRFVSPLGAGVVDDIVLEPAAAMGREIDGADVIVEDLQSELGTDGTRLGLVSLALEEWWDACGDEPLSAELWRRGEGVVGCLRRHADLLVAGLDADTRPLADALLVRLVSVEGQLLDVHEDDLLATSEAPERLHELIDRLLAARLLVRSGDCLRLSHPGLVDRWPRLRDLRLHDMDRLAFLEELRGGTKRWLVAGRARAHLLSAETTAEYRRRRADLAGELTEDERAFVEASLGARRLSWALRGLALLAVVSVIVTGWWLDQSMERRNREQAERLEQARVSAAVGRLVTRSRRTADPYVRVALLAGAISLGSSDPLLPLELFSSARGLPQARFLTLAKVSQPAFPWGQRWLIGAGRAHTTVFDFEPPAGPDFAPFQFRYQPHLAGTYDVTPLSYDTAFVSRGQDGSVSLWRLEEDGQLALAARAPMKCLGGSSPVLAAEAAPVIVCASDGGIASWDLREPTKARLDPFVGRLLDVSSDGRWVAATRLRQVLLWSPADGRRLLMPVEEPPNLARFSPRDELVALVRGYRLEVFDPLATLERGGGEVRPLWSADTLVSDPVGARWSPSGTDLAVCNYNGEGDWYYLRKGGRAAEDPLPPSSPRPCDPDTAAAGGQWPKRLLHASDYDRRVAGQRVGPRLFEGGWQLEDGRQISRDLVMFDPADQSLGELTRFVGKPKEPPRPGESVAAVVRDGTDLVWQVGEQVRLYDQSGSEVLRRDGHLLARCPDGRLLAYDKSADLDAPTWRLFGVRHEVSMGAVEREPAFVLGADPDCERVYFQRHDGQIASVAVGGEPGSKKLEPLKSAGAGFVVEGYVFDARPSAAAAGRPAGLWMALSSGAMIRVDRRGIEAWGHAATRASAMGDGPRPAELLFADDSGVALRRQGGKDRLVLGADSEREWSDVAVLPGGHTALLAWAHGVAVLDLEQAELVGEIETRTRGRLTAWDEGGSYLVWPFDFMGQPRGDIIPVAKDLAAKVGAAASNLRATLGPGLQPFMSLTDG